MALLRGLASALLAEGGARELNLGQHRTMTLWCHLKIVNHAELGSFDVAA